MRVVQTLMMLLAALAVLMAGAAPASALADAASPPCHESPAHHPDAEAPSPESGETMTAMHCCVASMTEPALRAPERARVISPRPATTVLPMALPAGERPAPEPHPPRPTLL